MRTSLKVVSLFVMMVAASPAFAIDGSGSNPPDPSAPHSAGNERDAIALSAPKTEQEKTRIKNDNLRFGRTVH